MINDNKKWKAVLVEIALPKTWANVNPDENEFYVEKDFHINNLSIPVKWYASNFEFYHTIKECFTKAGEFTVAVQFIEHNVDIVFEPSEGISMLITGKLALQLGFELDVALTGNKSNNNVSILDMLQGLYM